MFILSIQFSLGFSFMLFEVMVLMGAMSIIIIQYVDAQNQTAGREEVQKFTAYLIGDSEVPPVTTNATGIIDLVLNYNGNQMSYDIEVEEIEGATQAHIHQGVDGENGPILVTLFNASNPIEDVYGTMLESGDFTAEDFEGPLQGRNMSDLVDVIIRGEAYVNVHTDANLPGEIRGNIEQASDVFTSDEYDAFNETDAIDEDEFFGGGGGGGAIDEEDFFGQAPLR